MYKCEDCGNIFDEPNIIYDDPSPTGVSLPSGCYEIPVCPHCGAEGGFVELSNCAVCGEYTESDSGEFCGECINDFERYVASPIRDKVGKPEDVLASYFEGYPKDGGLCTYCDGGNCEHCKEVTTAVIETACRTIGCTADEIEGMASQYWGW